MEGFKWLGSECLCNVTSRTDHTFMIFSRPWSLPLIDVSFLVQQEVTKEAAVLRVRGLRPRFPRRPAAPRRRLRTRPPSSYQNRSPSSAGIRRWRSSMASCTSTRPSEWLWVLIEHIQKTDTGFRLPPAWKTMEFNLSIFHIWITMEEKRKEKGFYFQSRIPLSKQLLSFFLPFWYPSFRLTFISPLFFLILSLISILFSSFLFFLIFFDLLPILCPSFYLSSVPCFPIFFSYLIPSTLVPHLFP